MVRTLVFIVLVIVVYRVEAKAQPVNTPPVFTPVHYLDGPSGGVQDFSFIVTDAETPQGPFTFSGLSLESYLPSHNSYGGAPPAPLFDGTLDPATGVMTWNTDGFPKGEYLFRTSVTDPGGLSSVEPGILLVEFNILGPDYPPEITPEGASIEGVVQGDTVTFDFDAFDEEYPDGPFTFTGLKLEEFYTVKQGVKNPPFNASIDPATGSFTWDTTGFARGEYIFTFYALDPLGFPSFDRAYVFVEIATPEPSSAVFLGMAFMCLALRRGAW